MLRGFDDDMRRGSLQSTEELVIGALVMAPFVAVPVIVLYHAGWPPLLMLVLFTIVLEITAAVWNAGWRARPEPVRDPVRDGVRDPVDAGAGHADKGGSHAD